MLRYNKMKKCFTVPGDGESDTSPSYFDRKTGKLKLLRSSSCPKRGTMPEICNDVKCDIESVFH